jgi:hypothetical protein
MLDIYDLLAADCCINLLVLELQNFAFGFELLIGVHFCILLYLQVVWPRG